MSRVKYIDPMIGTVGDEQQSSFHGGGKTHPGATLPGGMVQLSPDTTTSGDNGTGYNYCQGTIEGFSFNHMSGIGWYGDLGNLQIMPVVGKTDLRSGSNAEIPFLKGTSGWKSPFSHEREHAEAGYYSVVLDRYNILVEASATMHAGILSIAYPKGSDAGVLFNFSRRIAGKADFQSIQIVNNTRIEGVINCTPKGGGFGRGAGNIGYDLYFVCELSAPATSLRFFSNEEYVEGDIRSFSGEDVGLDARFNVENGEPITIKCAISYTDMDGAKANFEAECVGASLKSVRENATKAWERALECIEVEGEDEIDLTLFHTCLYHALLDPRTSMDVNGKSCVQNNEACKADYTHRTMFSGWDVYRSEMPLLTIIRPDIINDEINSLLSIAKANNSSLPRWELMGIDSGCMVGDPGLLVLADAYVKGIRDYDVENAYKICLASARGATELDGKPFHSLHPSYKQYVEDAYVPYSLSSTLELLLASYAMYRLADAMNKPSDAEHFLNRAKRYADSFNPETGFMAPRDENGDFQAIRDRYDTLGCVESNIFQQSWFVPYDIEGVLSLFGRERAISLLEELFEGANLSALWNENYNHSNEPCHNLTHYFSVLGLEKRTQYWTRRVQKEAYRLGAFGFCGNEDVGQLSAWYVLSAIGIAQLCPAKKELYINTPLFKKAKITLSPKYHSCTLDTKFLVTCDKDPLTYPYIEKAYLNGKELNRPYITYDELTSGGELHFVLTEECEQ